jgi:predicted anti-sigma-YlaC factor YlaD
MTCKAAQELLADYSVGRLTRKTNRQLEAHLSACSHCAYELEILWRVIAFIENTPSRCPPPGLWEGIEAPIRQAMNR